MKIVENRTVCTAIVLFGIVMLTGCLSSMFRDKVEIKRVDVERYDPNTGRPRKMCRIVDKREIEVEFVGEDGSVWTEKIRLEGGNWSPPALPEKAEIVPQ